MSTSGNHSTQSSISHTEPSSIQIHRTLSRPRPRPVLSCLRCRSRKIKCDRLLPCKQCTLTGHDRYCSYHLQPKAESSSSQSHNGRTAVQVSVDSSTVETEDKNLVSAVIRQSQNSLERVEDLLSLQQRIQTLERICRTHSSTPVNTSSVENGSNAEGSRAQYPKIDAALSIKSSGPRYHSENYKKSLLHHVSWQPLST